MQIWQRLGTLGGVARRSQLVRTAADRRDLATALSENALRDLGGGWIATIDAPSSVVAARRYNATITCVSAAPFYSLQRLVDPSQVHLAIPRRRGVVQGPGRPRAVLHPESSWSSPDESAVRLAPLVDVLVRVLRCRPAPEAVVMIDSALNQGLIEVEEISRSLAGPGSPRARATLARCDVRSRSVTETLARLALRDAGLRVAAGVEIEGVGEVDLVVEDRLVVECDGYAYHSGRREYRNDRRRDRELLARGYLVLRFTSDEITDRPELVVEAVLRMLAL